MHKIIMSILIAILSVSVYFNAKQRSTIADYKNKYDHLECYDCEVLSVAMQPDPVSLLEKFIDPDDGTYWKQAAKAIRVPYEAEGIICLDYHSGNSECFFQADLAER